MTYREGIGWGRWTISKSLYRGGTNHVLEFSSGERIHNCEDILRELRRGNNVELMMGSERTPWHRTYKDDTERARMKGFVDGLMAQRERERERANADADVY